MVAAISALREAIAGATLPPMRICHSSEHLSMERRSGGSMAQGLSLHSESPSQRCYVCESRQPSSRPLRCTKALLIRFTFAHVPIRPSARPCIFWTCISVLTHLLIASSFLRFLIRPFRLRSCLDGDFLELPGASLLLVLKSENSSLVDSVVAYSSDTTGP